MWQAYVTGIVGMGVLFTLWAVVQMAAQKMFPGENKDKPKELPSISCFGCHNFGKCETRH